RRGARPRAQPTGGLIVRTFLLLASLSFAAAVAVPAAGHRTAPVLEGVTVRVGDTLRPYYSVQTDSVLTVAPGVAIAAKCGTSKVYLRLLLHGQRVTNDTVLVNVTGCPAPAPVLTTLTLYKLVNDTLYAVTGDTIPVAATACYVGVGKTASGQIVTGQPVHLATSDSTVARVGVIGACPDTTVDPARYVVAP
ncbi:MAG: hypothetical protein KGI71_05275, partial [Patescibacteria group bacterium]|nr:hypothetical protein [Patescibacteria group bacterium]